MDLKKWGEFEKEEKTRVFGGRGEKKRRTVHSSRIWSFLQDVDEN